MSALLGLALAVFIVSAVVGTVGRLMAAALWTFGVLGALAWLAATPEPPIVAAICWALGAWLAWVLLGHALRHLTDRRAV